MQHHMAISADRPQVFDRADLVFFPYFSDRPQMVDVYEPLSYFAILLFKIKAANDA